MAQTLSPSRINSTNVRFVFETLARRIGLRTSALLAPGFAGMWAERLFLTPPQPRYPSAEVFDLLDARVAQRIEAFGEEQSDEDAHNGEHEDEFEQGVALRIEEFVFGLFHADHGLRAG